jgi:hypothetical protein
MIASLPVILFNVANVAFSGTILALKLKGQASLAETA